MEGIIYKIQPYLESSRLLFVYTQQGKMTLLAKGAQKEILAAQERALKEVAGDLQ